MANFSVLLGDSKTLTIPLRWDGYDFDPDGWSLIFTAKRQATDPDALAVIQKASGAGIQIDGGNALVSFIHEDTADIDIGTLVYDIQAQNIVSQQVRTVAVGGIVLQRDITRSTKTSRPIFTEEQSIPLLIPGPANTISIGSVTPSSDGTAQAAFRGTAPNQILDLVLPRGIQGLVGPVGTTSWNGLVDKPATFTPTIGSGAADAVAGNDSRLTNSRIPSGAAGGVLSGTYPNPLFAVDMATQAELDAHAANTSNPHATTKAQVGLGNVTNTSDENKPVSTAQQTALNLKANINSPTFTGIVNGITASMIGLGNVNNTLDSDKPVSYAQQTALDLKANLNSPTFTGTVNGITPSMIGLGNVTNTSDANKPVSTAQQTAINVVGNKLSSLTRSAAQGKPTQAADFIGQFCRVGDSAPYSFWQADTLTSWVPRAINGSPVLFNLTQGIYQKLTVIGNAGEEVISIATI